MKAFVFKPVMISSIVALIKFGNGFAVLLSIGVPKASLQKAKPMTAKEETDLIVVMIAEELMVQLNVRLCLLFANHTP